MISLGRLVVDGKCFLLKPSCVRVSGAIRENIFRKFRGRRRAREYPMTPQTHGVPSGIEFSTTPVLVEMWRSNERTHEQGC
jgi:hypothetical protein